MHIFKNEGGVSLKIDENLLLYIWKVAHHQEL